MKLPNHNYEAFKRNEATAATEDLSRQELGGLLVYDSYARLIGSTKIVDYQLANPPKRIDPYIVFSKEEVHNV